MQQSRKCSPWLCLLCCCGLRPCLPQHLQSVFWLSDTNVLDWIVVGTGILEGERKKPDDLEKKSRIEGEAENTDVNSEINRGTVAKAGNFAAASYAINLSDIMMRFKYVKLKACRSLASEQQEIVSSIKIASFETAGFERIKNRRFRRNLIHLDIWWRFYYPGLVWHKEVSAIFLI